MEGPPEFGGIHPAASTFSHILPLHPESLRHLQLQQEQQQFLQQQHPHHSQFQLQAQLPSQRSDLMGSLDQWPPAFGFPHSHPTPSSFQHSPPGPLPPPFPPLHSIPFQQLPPPLSHRPHSYSAYCGSLRDQLFRPPVSIQLPPGYSINPAEEYELSAHGIIHSSTYQPHIPFQQPVIVQPASEEEINEIVVSPTISVKPRRERKRRTAIDPWVKEELEAEFQSKKKPNQMQLSRLSGRLGVEKDFVRIWYRNRRQRQKKLDQELSKALQRAGQSTVEIAVPSTAVKIPSPCKP